jgi:hypothetical protein
MDIENLLSVEDLVLRRQGSGMVMGRPRPARRPSSRALVAIAPQAAWLVPFVEGASQLRDSTGFAPASLRAVE